MDELCGCEEEDDVDESNVPGMRTGAKRVTRLRRLGIAYDDRGEVVMGCWSSKLDLI